MFGSSWPRRLNAGLVSSAILAASAVAGGAQANATEWVVHPEWVKAHEDFLASAPLKGRGSATPDEAVAAAYVASEFESYGLRPAPGMNSYIQVAHVIRPRLAGTPTLKIAGGPTLSSLKLIVGAADLQAGYASFDGADPTRMPQAQAVIVTNPGADLQQLIGAAQARQVRLLILAQSPATERLHQALGGRVARSYLEGSQPPSSPLVVASLSSDDISALARASSRQLLLSASVRNEIAETTNAIGYLPGTDPKAGILLVSAHLDHLGIVDGTLMPGANDDASGTTGVLELAHALAAGAPMRRGMLFVCYGSEEIGGLGSRYFGEHPPVPLASIVANLELEMIGSQDPRLPAGHLMMTGFERSNFGQILKSKGALVASDPYPEQHFFQRSDNYSLALKGIVAHTVSGWAVVPTYHRPTDTIANLDIGFMVRAIQSLVEPLRFIANGNETPHWLAGGRPEEK